MAEVLLDGIDGLLLSGGSDLDPDNYGEECAPELGVTVPERDAFEMALVRLALGRGMPIFGICRGMQVLNVALGGTPYQDLPSQLGKDILNHWQETPKWHPAHEIEVLHDSRLAEIIGCQAAKVNDLPSPGDQSARRRSCGEYPLFRWSCRGCRVPCLHGAVACRRPVARRDNARGRDGAPRPLRSPRLRCETPHPTHGP